MGSKGNPESVILRECLDFLQLKNIYCWRNNTGAISSHGRFIKFGFPGSSDILGICPDGRFLAIECKREKGGKVSELQEHFISHINQNGGVAIVVNSLDALISALKDSRVIDEE